MTACFEAKAQNFFLGVLNNSNAIPVNSSLTYTLGVTNLANFVIANIFVTNSLPSSVQIIGNTTKPGTTVSTNGNRLIFFIANIGIGSNVVMTVTARPTVAGFFTNTVSVFSQQLTNVIIVRSVVQATNPIVRGDLGVSLVGPAQPVFTGDWTTYGISVTNLGASTVTNVFLTNTLPAGVKLLGIIPATQSFTLTNGTLIFPFASLTNRGFQNLTVRVQMPTNAGPALFSASVAATNLLDTNAVNNVATTNVNVLDFLSAQLTVTNVTAMTNNPQTGLFNEVVRLSNRGTNSVAAARIIVVGVAKLSPGTGTRLYNAVGTNNGSPFVVYGNTLNPGQNADLVLEYYSTTSHQPFSIQNSNYVAVAVGPADFSSTGGTNSSLTITNIVRLPNGDMLIGFKAVPGKTYTVIYGDSPASTPLTAQPSFVAPADIVQWIDNGPPKTIAHPSTAPSRFYRVRQEP